MVVLTSVSLRTVMFVRSIISDTYYNSPGVCGSKQLIWNRIVMIVNLKGDLKLWCCAIGQY